MVLNILECDKKLPMYALAAKVGDGTLGCIRKVWADDPSPQLCGKTQLESWEFCSMFSKAGIDILKEVQQRALKMIKGSQTLLSCKKCLRELELLSLRAKLRGSLLSHINI